MAAFEALLMRFGCLEAVRDAPVAKIFETIFMVTFAEVKAPRIKTALNTVTSMCGRLTLDGLDRRAVEDALVWLERLPGVGRKVAASTLNLSTLRKVALVIDTHHLRILKRLQFVGRRSDARRAYDQVMPLLPLDWSANDFAEHHQLMKILGQKICRHGTAICLQCPLNDLCPAASACCKTPV